MLFWKRLQYAGTQIWCYWTDFIVFAIRDDNIKYIELFKKYFKFTLEKIFKNFNNIYMYISINHDSVVINFYNVSIL